MSWNEFETAVRYAGGRASEVPPAPFGDRGRRMAPEAFDDYDVERESCGVSESYLFAALAMLPSCVLLRLDDDVVWHLSHGGIDHDAGEGHWYTDVSHLMNLMQEDEDQIHVASRGDARRFETTGLKWGDKGYDQTGMRVVVKRNGRPQQPVRLLYKYMTHLRVKAMFNGHMDLTNLCYFPLNRVSDEYEVQPPWTHPKHPNAYYDGAIMLNPNEVEHGERVDISEKRVVITSTATFAKFSSRRLSKTCYIAFEPRADGDAESMWKVEGVLLDASRENGTSFAYPKRVDDGSRILFDASFSIWDVVDAVLKEEHGFSCVRGRIPKDAGMATLFTEEAVENVLSVEREHYKNIGLETNDVYYRIVDARAATMDGVPPRGILIGDIHASIVSLCSILEDVRSTMFEDAESDFLKPNHHVYFLGDLVDRGPYSIAVLVLAMRLRQRNPDTVHILNGNHETCSMFTQKAAASAGVAPMSLADELEEQYLKHLRT